jgi:hypothetical protein
MHEPEERSTRPNADLLANQDARLRDLGRRQRRTRHWVTWRWSARWGLNATGLLISVSLSAGDPQGLIINSVWLVNLVCASVWAWQELRSLPRQEALERECLLATLRWEAQCRT